MHLRVEGTGCAGDGDRDGARGRCCAAVVLSLVSVRPVAWGDPYTGTMSCRISELVLNCDDPELLARFWSDVLGYVELDREDGMIEIGPADAGFGGLQPTIILSASSNPRVGRLPLHIDVNPVDRDQDAELERLLALGARPADVGQTGDEQWHVLQDPEGNEFCLLRKRLSS